MVFILLCFNYEPATIVEEEICTVLFTILFWFDLLLGIPEKAFFDYNNTLDFLMCFNGYVTLLNNLHIYELSLS